MHFLPGGSYNPNSNRNGSSDDSLLGELFSWLGDTLSKLAEEALKGIAYLAGMGAAIFLLWILYSSVTAALTALYTGLAEIWSGFIPPSAFVTPILLGAAAGALIGWLRRGLGVRSRFHESLLSSFFTKAWLTRTPLLAAADVLVHAIVGYFVGLVFAYSTVPHPRLSGGHLSPFYVVLVIAGGGPGGGGGGEIDPLSLLVALLAIILISAIVGASVMTIHKASILAFVRLVSVRATRAAAPGAAKGAAKELVIMLVEEGDVQWSAVGASALKGAIVGVVIAALAEVYPVLK